MSYLLLIKRAWMLWLLHIFFFGLLDRYTIHIAISRYVINSFHNIMNRILNCHLKLLHFIQFLKHIYLFYEFSVHILLFLYIFAK